MEHVSSLACQCIVVVSHCLHIGKLLKMAQPIRNYLQTPTAKEMNKEGFSQQASFSSLLPSFSNPLLPTLFDTCHAE